MNKKTTNRYLCYRLGIIVLMSILTPLKTAYAEHVNIAVASNFSAVMKALIKDFETTSNHQIKASFASSGKFYAQIKYGAPYGLFFSADQDKPQKLEQEGFVSSELPFTYAIGALALWSSKPDMAENLNALKSGRFNKLALANPKLAPYGIAAVETLKNLDLVQTTQDKWIKGENIAQTYQFVSTGNADLGFIALSQISHASEQQGSYWIVDNDLYNPIQQDAVLLKRGEKNAAALAFWNYMHSDKAKALIQSYGYSVPKYALNNKETSQ